LKIARILSLPKKTDGVPRFTNSKKTKDEISTGTGQTDSKADETKASAKPEIKGGENKPSLEKTQSEKVEPKKVELEKVKSESAKDQATSSTSTVTANKSDTNKQNQTQVSEKVAQQGSTLDLNNEEAKRSSSPGGSKRNSQIKESETPKAHDGGFKRHRFEPRKLEKNMLSDAAIQKFKIKTTEKDLAKACTSFQDYVLDNWEKKSNIQNPTTFDPRWADQKNKLQESSSGSTPTAGTRSALKTSGKSFTAPQTTTQTTPLSQPKQYTPQPQYPQYPMDYTAQPQYMPQQGMGVYGMGYAPYQPYQMPTQMPYYPPMDQMSMPYHTRPQGGFQRGAGPAMNKKPK